MTGTIRMLSPSKVVSIAKDGRTYASQGGGAVIDAHESDVHALDSAGYSLAIAPRSDEPISFAQLRGLADGYDLLRTVIETRKDQVERLRWSIRRSDLSDATPRNRDDDPRIAAIEAFLRMPDRVHFWSTWLRQLLEDLFVADAPTLYLRRNRGGQIHALSICAGTTLH